MSKNFLLILSLLFLFIISLFIYKLYENWVFKQFVEIYNNSNYEELDLLSLKDKANEEFLKNYLIEPQKQNSDTSQSLDKILKLEKSLDKLIYYEENYTKLITENKKKYEYLDKKTNFLLGNKKLILKRIINLIENYYKYEFSFSKQNNLYYYALKNFIDLTKNYIILNEIKNITSREELKKNYYTYLSPLEKYTKKEFKFYNEEEIKQKMPLTYDQLNKIKIFLSSFYNFFKNYIVSTTIDLDKKFDYNQELRKLAEAEASVSYDFSILSKESESIFLDLEDKISSIVSETLSEIKKFKEKNKNYLSEIDEDLVLCQYYQYKASKFYTLNSKLPASKNKKDLINELSQILPRNDYIDKSFNFDVMDFENNGKKLVFKCRSKKDNKKYEFIVIGW